MERFVREKGAINGGGGSNGADGSQAIDTLAANETIADEPLGRSPTIQRLPAGPQQQQQQQQSGQAQLAEEPWQKLLRAHSSCSGALDGNGSPSAAQRGDLLYE